MAPNLSDLGASISGWQYWGYRAGMFSGVSIFGLQLAHAMGVQVVITSSSDEKLARAKNLGANKGINYKSTPDWEKAAMEFTGGRGVDQVIEVGGAGTLTRSFGAIRKTSSLALRQVN
jgi:NADPH:quinone reductase-like Zn-dependent oxidoreductase